MEEIKNSLKNYKVLLKGLGGMGKTHLSNLYIKKYYNSYEQIIWMEYNRNFSYTLIKGMWKWIPEQIRVLSEKEQFETALTILSTLEQTNKWLSVIDNASDIEGLEWKKLLGTGCHILITSREHSVFNYGMGLKEIEVEPLNKRECIQLFQYYYDQNRYMENNKILEIVKELRQNTLLIELAAKSARAAGLTPSELLNYIQKDKLLTDIKEQVYDNREHIYRKPTEIILSLFSVVGLEKTEIRLLSFLSSLPYGQYKRSTVFKWTNYKNQNVFNSLIQKGWIQDNNLSISVHPNVAEAIYIQTNPTFYKLKEFVVAIKKWAEKDEIPKEIISNLPNIVLWFKDMCKNIKIESKFLYISSTLIHLCAKYYLFVDGLDLYNTISELYQEENVEFAELLESVCELYITMGRLPEALEELKKCKRIKKQFMEDHSKEMTGLYMQRALIYRDLDKPRMSIFYYKKALSIEKNYPSEYNEKLIIIYTFLARVILEFNSTDILKSLQYCQEALNIVERKKKEDLSTAFVYNRYGFTLLQSGKYQEGDKYLKKALSIRRNLLGERNPDTAATINNVGYLYYLCEDFNTAEEHLKLALAIRLEVLGDLHVGTATTYNNLGRVYLKRGDYKLARGCFLKALRIRRKVLGKKSKSTLYVYYNIGNMYEKQKIFNRSLIIYKFVYYIRKEILGKENIETKQAYKDMEKIYFQLYRK